MTDDDLRALFHRIDDGPPLGLDVHAVMTRGRRVRTRRAAMAVVGSTLAITAAAAIGLTAGGDVQRPEIVRPAEPPVATTSQPAPTPPATMPGPVGNPAPENNAPVPNGNPAPTSGMPEPDSGPPPTG